MMVQNGQVEASFEPSVAMLEGWAADLGGVVNRIGRHFARRGTRACPGVPQRIAGSRRAQEQLATGGGGGGSDALWDPASPRTR